MARGGLTKMRVNFKGHDITLSQLFGSSPIPVTDMTKKLWGYIKKQKLLKKLG